MPLLTWICLWQGQTANTISILDNVLVIVFQWIAISRPAHLWLWMALYNAFETSRLSAIHCNVLHGLCIAWISGIGHNLQNGITKQLTVINIGALLGCSSLKWAFTGSFAGSSDTINMHGVMVFIFIFYIIFFNFDNTYNSKESGSCWTYKLNTF